MSARLSIRRATERDAVAVAQLAGELGAEVMRGRIRALIASAADLFIVALDSFREKAKLLFSGADALTARAI